MTGRPTQVHPKWMISGVTTSGVVIGALLGVPAGMAVQFCLSAWANYKDTKAKVPGLRKGAWASTRRLAKWVLVGIAVVFVLVVWMVNEGKPIAGLQPAGVPVSGSPGSTPSHHR